ncbi:hypothetical protein D3C77_558830 [compost metagenome]
MQIQFFNSAALGLGVDPFDKLFGDSHTSCRRGNIHTGKPGTKIRSVGQIVRRECSTSQQPIMIKGDQALPSAIALTFGKFLLPVC